MKTNHQVNRILLFFFFCSGICGLIYEVLWTRLLSLILGSSTVAGSIVLACYLGGMALGATLISSRVDRMSSPAKIYGGLEISLGLFGLLSPWLFGLLNSIYLELAGGEFHSLGFRYLVSAGLSTAIMLFPTVCLGATFPVLVRQFAGQAMRWGSWTGFVYALNLFGAVVGAVVAAFYLLPAVGIRQTSLLAGGLNILIGLSAIGMAGRIGGPLPLSPHQNSELHRSFGRSSWTDRGLAFLSGALCLALEVFWFRSLDLVLGTSSQAFSVMLAVFLLGLGIGAVLVTWILKKFAYHPRLLPLIFLVSSVTLCLSMNAFQHTPDWFIYFYRHYDLTSLELVLTQVLLAVLVLLPLTTVLGMLFPAVLLVGDSESRQVGRVAELSAWNTLGCISGALVAGLLAIPLFGIAPSLLGIRWFFLAAVLLALFPVPGRAVHRTAYSTAAMVIIFAAGYLFPGWDVHSMTSGVYMYAHQMKKVGYDRYASIDRSSPVLFYKEGISGSVSVKQRRAARVLSVDGRAEGSERSVAQFLLGHVPFAVQRDQAIEDALLVGFGTGSTAGSVLLHPIKHLRVVELESAVVEASKLFEATNHRPLQDPRTELLIEDARVVLSLSQPASYDLILSQPSNPWVAGAAKLFTREFYSMVRSRLRPQGLFGQWVQLYAIDRESLRMFLLTLQDAFSSVLLLDVGQGSGEILVLASQAPIVLSGEKIIDLFADSSRKADLNATGVATPGSLAARILFGSTELGEFSEGALLNTDDQSRLEYRMFYSLLNDTAVANLNEIRKYPASREKYLMLPDAPDLKRQMLLEMANEFIQQARFPEAEAVARQSLSMRSTVEAWRTVGDALYAQRRAVESVSAWQQARRLNPKDQPTLRRLVRHFLTLPKASRPAEFSAWCSQTPELAHQCD